jgi:hypothetical protein
MDLTRREFLGYTAAATGLVGLPLPQPASVASADSKVDRWRVFVVYDRVNSESFWGYTRTLPKARQLFSADESDSISCCSLVIVPDVVLLDPRFSWALVRALQRGASVVIETGVGFASHSTFRHHRRSLREGLQIPVGAPVDLWADRPKARAPYIEFTWPHRTTIRDFSRVVPPADRPGDDVIAWAGDLAVAFRRRVGNGTLIYLGSPVGPALWAGDVEARRWLNAVALAA